MWIVKTLLICGDVILWVIDFLHYNKGQFITLSNVYGDVNSWVGFTHKILEHQSPSNNDGSAVMKS